MFELEGIRENLRGVRARIKAYIKVLQHTEHTIDGT